MAQTSDYHWQQSCNILEKLTGQKPASLNVALFILGVQELGKGIQEYSKEDKRDLISLAVCMILAHDGYFERKGIDDKGWPTWKSIKNLPFENIMEEEGFLLQQLYQYLTDTY